MEKTAKKAFQDAVEAINSDRTEDLKTIINKSSQVLFLQDDTLGTLAIVAVNGNHLESLKIIAEKAPSALAITDKFGNTPAIKAANDDGFECFKIIAKAAPGTLYIANGEIWGKWTPALKAAFDGSIKCLEIIAEIAPETLFMRARGGTMPNSYLDLRYSEEVYNQYLNILKRLQKKWWQFWKKRYHEVDFLLTIRG
jgi:hypothetical protein